MSAADDKSKKAAAPAATPELLVLILSYGMNGSELAVTIDGLKNASKQIGTHKRRELFWNAYGKMIAKTSSMNEAAHCFLRHPPRRGQHLAAGV